MDDAADRGNSREVAREKEQGSSRSALIAGATGLVGGHLLERLLQNDLYSAVHALGRRPLERTHPKLTAVLADFDQLDDRAEAFQVDDVYCCLGSTIKKAGSQAAFRKVDYEYVANIARLARAAGARRFLLVSSIGADASTSNFYLSVKGEAEDAVAARAFRELHVFRPSLLAGSRDESRPGEGFGILAMRFLNPLLVAGLRRFRSIHPRTVASAMVAAARAGETGLHVYTFDEMRRLAGEAA